MPIVQKHINQPEPAPLTFGQQNLWFLHQLNPDSFAYNTFRAWRITGRLNKAILRRAIDALLLRHEPLRTCIKLIDGEPRQIVDPSPLCDYEYEDLRTEAGTAPEWLCSRIAVDESRTPLDIEHGPVFRVKVLRIDEFETIFLFVTHHAFIDGWSMEILARDLGEFFNARSSARQPDLPRLPFSYGDFAKLQRHVSVSSSQPIRYRYYDTGQVSVTD